MGQTFTWENDATTGVYKNHALSRELLMASARQWKFVPFTKLDKSFTKGMGQSITLVYYNPLSDPTSAKLTEDIRVPIDQLTMGKQTVTLYEWGRGVEFTSFAQDLSKFDPETAAQKALKDQMSQAMDVAAATEFVSTDAKVIFIPTSLTGGTWDTDGTASTQALANVTADHISTIRDYMVKDLHVPFFTGDHYIGLFSTKALRGLRNDRVIDTWHMYLRKGEKIYRGEIGQYESCRFVEISNESALSSGVGSADVLGEGLIFGDDAVARIEVDYPALRAQLNYTGDFGRRQAVAWVGTVGFGVKFPVATDRLARIVRITSS
ncbi:MAG: N4-gp56 family major capsid protein [Desulfosarcina sp.]|nr:N4-gp56 family major capsid protein [Desulfosarcina sp.]MBC2741549.1 N4-gp56 family major capsid protein [Desulfosarcina sp.]MBC2764463.1 N4-gp56 family major capsid protein [Desulfosarcina sp.]